METIFKEWCPKCGTHAYYNIGDTDDCTNGDMDGAKCPWCGHQWLWEGSEEIMKLEDRTIEDANFVKGEKELT